MQPTKTKFQTIDEYISIFPRNVQAILEKVRQTIKKAAPDAAERISYQIPTFKLDGKYLVARNKLGLTKDDLVRKSGVKHTTLTKIESNVVVKPSIQRSPKSPKR